MSAPRPATADPDWAVVINHEEQYSVWPADRQPPAGWAGTGEVGTREQCLLVISERWTDMRPLSLRQRMDDALPPGRR